MGLSKLIVRGARQNNLKNISLEIPRNSLTVITGLSGSGKSSLAFDTIYAEGQRRYVESLSAYARQFLDQMERPEVDVIEGLSPSIAIEQKTTTRSPRSTVGTITEIYDYLRVVYASVGVPHCPNCGNPITRQSSEAIVQSILQGELAQPDDRVMILAPIVRGRKGAYRKELEKLGQDGYVRVRINGELYPMDDLPALDKRKNHTIEVVVDRLLVKQGIASRLEQSVTTALKLASGLVTVAVVGGKVMERAPVADLVETPRHPYTMGLVDSVSSLESGRERLSAIPGNVPNPLAMPPGCPFAPRCQQAMSKCQQMPPIQRMEDGRHVACWLY